MSAVPTWVGRDELLGLLVLSDSYVASVPNVEYSAAPHKFVQRHSSTMASHDASMSHGTSVPSSRYDPGDGLQEGEKGRKRSLSTSHEQTPLLFLPTHQQFAMEDPDSKRPQVYSATLSARSQESEKKSVNLFYATVYALVNVIISAPGTTYDLLPLLNRILWGCTISRDLRRLLSSGSLLSMLLTKLLHLGLYGYAAVIFNHPVFRDHMNALSKLVIFSSMIHQLSFVLFSSMPFAIGTVQDAGLIFLSSMANTIANEMLAEGASEAAIVSTTLVILSLGTALLGLVLIGLGKFKLANAVSYLPMPVVGGMFLSSWSVA